MNNNSLNQKIYGAGYHAALRQHGIDQEDDIMNASRLASILNNLHTPERKIYDAVPIQDTWTTAQILGEINRKGGGISHISIGGTLNNLKKRGIIKEPIRGYFQKVEVKAKVKKEPVTQQKTTANSTPTQSEPEKNGNVVFDILMELSERAEKVELSTTQLKADIETAALKVADMFQDATAKSEKLVQLQAILKGLS